MENNAESQSVREEENFEPRARWPLANGIGILLVLLAWWLLCSATKTAYFADGWLLTVGLYSLKAYFTLVLAIALPPLTWVMFVNGVEDMDKACTSAWREKENAEDQRRRREMYPLPTSKERMDTEQSPA